jgi:hypothetical protein
MLHILKGRIPVKPMLEGPGVGSPQEGRGGKGEGLCKMFLTITVFEGNVTNS